MDKSEKKKLIEAYREKQKKEFLNSLPIPQEIFYRLFDYVDEQFEEKACMHNFDIAIAFLKNNNCPVNDVLEWLNEHGAGCDCEVFSIEEYLEEYR